MNITVELLDFARQVETLLMLSRGRATSTDDVLSFVQQKIRSWEGTQAIIDSMQAQIDSLRAAKSPVTVIPSTLPQGVVGTAYAAQVSGSGGTGAFVLFEISGRLPEGLSLDSTNGSIYGVPVRVQHKVFTIKVTDTGGMFGTLQFTIDVFPTLIIPQPVVVVPQGLPNGVLGVPYVAPAIAAIGGSGTYTTWGIVVPDRLPNGLVIDPLTGIISGTPNTAQLKTFRVQVTDSALAVGVQSFSIGITAS